MRYSWALFILTPLFAQQVDVTPRVGTIEIYGVRKVSAQKIEAALRMKPGDILTSRDDAQDRINKVNNIIASRIEAVCCNGQNLILYVGVDERESPHMEFHPSPGGDLSLAPSLLANYRRFLDEVEGSIRGKNADEDLTNGYSLMADPDCRSIQKDFVTAMETELSNVVKVVRESGDPEQRSAAAYLLQYAPRGTRTTPVMVDGIQWALQDDDETVRQAALGSLRAVMVGMKLHQEQSIHIEPTWLVGLMNSVVFSDRLGASQALVTLTEADPQALALIRSRALPAVAEMAKWRNLKDALPAFMLAGRLAGFDDAKTKDAWLKEDRESVLQALTARKGKSKS